MGAHGVYSYVSHDLSLLYPNSTIMARSLCNKLILSCLTC